MDDLKQIVEDMSKETFYTYSFVRRETMLPNDIIFTDEFKIAVKMGEKFYDVISSVPLATEEDSPLVTGIRVSIIEVASEDEITRVANKLANSSMRDINYYKQLMHKKLEQENKMRRSDIENQGELLKLVRKIGKSDQ